MRNDDQLWQAVLARAPGDFLYGVATMGIFCRPDCPSPRPLRRNTRFFASAAQAEAAGFRACKRCDPTGSNARLVAEVVRDACAAIDAAETPPSLDALARRAGYSRFHFLRLFRDRTGFTPRAYASARRAGRLGAALAGGERVADAIAGAGYGSESRVYERSDALLGMTPGAARRGGAGEAIRFGVAACEFGPLLVAETPRGLCFVGFAEPAAALEAELRRRFPRAALVRDDAALAARLDAVAAAIAEPGAGRDLPLDLRGTAFQLRVWRALCAIPAGRTLSYAALAEAAGQPGAARAAGRACGLNPLAPLVPCHRAVAANGALTGYRWGIPRKAALLARERAGG
ncbi:MAG: bifunctional DNA-binding transcriptional regulator/O6-methylguanine-DNA methyltransferase Ada [Rhodospirillales bacterium]|nr:bifunctional DNA-binding transcriptional regulator/O6-methylguanine-DNA methyltransferase Ada [Rhodospirillales bacterium]